MAQYVKLGPKASFFRCSGLDLSIAPNEVVGLNAKQLSHPTVRRALNGGHLVFTEIEKKEAKKEVKDKLTPEELKEAFLEMREAGDEDKKIIKSFSLADLTAIAGLYDIEVEADDKKADIFEAIVTAIEESDEDSDDSDDEDDSE